MLHWIAAVPNVEVHSLLHLIIPCLDDEVHSMLHMMATQSAPQLPLKNLDTEYDD